MISSKKTKRKPKRTGTDFMRRGWTALLVAAMLCACLGFAQSKKKGDDEGRTVQGVVTTPDDKPPSSEPWCISKTPRRCRSGHS